MALEGKNSADPTKEYAELLIECRDFATSSIQRVGEVRDGTADLLLLALFATLIEYANAALLLASKRLSSADDAIFRSFLEGFVDLKNLLQDQNYVDAMWLEHHEGWNKVHISAANGNPFFVKIASDESSAEAVAEHRRQIKNLKRKGVRKLHPEDKFAKAGDSEIYNSIYSFSSREIHNGIGSLLRRHVSERDNQLVIQLGHWDPARCCLRLDGYTSMLLESIECLLDYFDIEVGPQMAETSSKLQDLRRRYARGNDADQPD